MKLFGSLTELVSIIFRVGSRQVTVQPLAQTVGDGTLQIPDLAGTTTTIATNPMNALGDTVYGGASGLETKLVGNILATKKFLNQTGTGSVSAAPEWDSIAASDIPSLDAAKVTTGIFNTARIPAATDSAAGSVSRETSGTFSATFTQSGGYSQTVTISYALSGKVATLFIPSFAANCTNTSNILASSVLPVALRPSTTTYMVYPAQVSATFVAALLSVNSTGNIALYKDMAASVFVTTTPTCGVGVQFSVTYGVQ